MQRSYCNCTLLLRSVTILSVIVTRYAITPVTMYAVTVRNVIV